MKRNSLWILGGLLIVVIGLPACGSGGGGGGCVLSGIITNNSSVNPDGVTYTIGIDTDVYMDNGKEIAVFQGVWPGGKSANYAFDITEVPPGSYYVWVKIEVPGQYTLYGFYDGWTPLYQPEPKQTAVIECGASINLLMDQT